jgi:hypothetical protein
MRKISVMFLLFFILGVNAQKVINVDGQLIKMTLVDTKKFDIRGLWEIVDKQFFYDDGECSKLKWDKIDKGNVVFISDSLFYACSSDLFCNLITNPIFEKKIDSTFSTGGQFFKQFSDTVLHISVWTKQDLISSKAIVDPVATYEISILNNDYMVIAENNSFRYLRRITKPTGTEGWKKEGNFETIVYNQVKNFIRIHIDVKKPQKKDGYIEYIFVPNKKTKDAKLSIFTFSSKELEDTKNPTILIEKRDNPGKDTLKGHFPLNRLSTNSFSILQGNKYNGSAGKFLWRIVETY